ncbi:uncharacterized protein LOC119301224 [Triticum dicoccoides]|uniref:Uncharacterized protein n=1 Tax=Triticum turgidum subsp. durum TaxID=4567 RepID=A0A9R0V5M6_TRITD|nr:uncharacterized protein LOC119301224 [Triticum dicoccoides]VAH13124.1 unnamed protein product [Triticum turgidum subsp. durum]
MAGGCKAAIGCVDARVPVRASYVSLYKWPESDAEFVRSVAMARRHRQQPESPAAAGCYSGGSASMRRGAGVDVGGESPRVVDSYSCRQMYLRSYTFSTRKETVPERTMACLGRVRERAAVFPSFLPHRVGGGGSDAGSSFGSSSGGGGQYSGRDQDGRRGTTAGSNGRRKRRRKKKGCAVVRRLQEASCGAVRAIFRRLLACTTTVDVEVAEPPPGR